VLTLPQLYLVTFGAGALSVLFNVSDGGLLVQALSAPFAVVADAAPSGASRDARSGAGRT
jgi:hypothetical protein